MTCRSCTQARDAAKSSIKAFASGDILEGATRAKEMGIHLADKAKAESERVRSLMSRKKP